MRHPEGPNAAERGYLSIREVLELLVSEYPDVTISKIRFLEGKGLIHPERTPSGYRKFYEADVERLRWILRQQRENFLPLKVIKGRLDRANALGQAAPSESLLFDDEVEASLVEPALVGASVAHGQRDGAPAKVTSEAAKFAVTGALENRARLDDPVRGTGELDAELETTVLVEVVEAVEVEPVRTARARNGSTPQAGAKHGAMSVGASLNLAELSGASGADLGLILDLESFGLIASREVAGEKCFDEQAVAVARLAASFARYGVEPRHLRSFKHAAERDAGLYAQVVVPLLRQHNPAARERALAELGDLVSLGSQLRDAFVETELRALTGG